MVCGGGDPRQLMVQEWRVEDNCIRRITVWYHIIIIAIAEARLMVPSPMLPSVHGDIPRMHTQRFVGGPVQDSHINLDSV
jgi:hypothetical protein